MGRYRNLSGEKQQDDICREETHRQYRTPEGKQEDNARRLKGKNTMIYTAKIDRLKIEPRDKGWQG